MQILDLQQEALLHKVFKTLDFWAFSAQRKDRLAVQADLCMIRTRIVFFMFLPKPKQKEPIWKLMTAYKGFLCHIFP